MKTLCKLFVSFVLSITFLTSPACPFEGPFQVKNLYPLFLHADQPYLEKALMENSLSFSLSHSSTYTVQESARWLIHLDMEVTELTFRYKRIMKDFIEFGVDVPVLYIWEGFMDGFLESWHNALGVGDYGRSERPKNEFLYEVREDGELVIKGERGVRLGDIRLALKKPLLSTDRYSASVAGNIEIPVGNAETGFSNGSLDFGLSLYLDALITDTIMTYWNAGAVFPGDVKGYKTVDLKNFIYGGAAVEGKVGKGFSLLVQLLGQSRIYPETDIQAVDREAVLIAFGGRYNTEKSTFDLSLTEDLSVSGAPDFIINFTYKVKL